MGFVPPDFDLPGTTIGMEIRGRQFAAAVVPKPIYKRGQ
jgi:glycine cleavage system aminomethyltransferase T